MVNRAVGNIGAATVLFVGFTLSFHGLYYCISTVQLPPELSKAGQFQFFTNISLVASLFTYALALVSHVTKSHRLFRWKNNVQAIALSLETVVTSLYWPLRLLFAALLAKDPEEKLMPTSIDLCVHLVPFVTLLVDYLAFLPRWEVKPSTGVLVSALFAVGYRVWLQLLLDLENGAEYPYNFLNGDSEITRSLVFAVVGIWGYSLFIIWRAVHGGEDHTKKFV